MEAHDGHQRRMQLSTLDWVVEIALSTHRRHGGVSRSPSMTGSERYEDQFWPGIDTSFFAGSKKIPIPVDVALEGICQPFSQLVGVGLGDRRLRSPRVKDRFPFPL
jgi:hypothetical protein